MYFVSPFVYFSLIVQIWFFVDIFYHKNRYNIPIGWKDFLIFLLIIALGVVVMLMYIFVQEFTDFLNKKVMILLPSLFYLWWMTILVAIYWFLSFLFFMMVILLKKQESPITLQKQ